MYWLLQHNNECVQMSHDDFWKKAICTLTHYRHYVAEPDQLSSGDVATVVNQDSTLICLVQYIPEESES